MMGQMKMKDYFERAAKAALRGAVIGAAAGSAALFLIVADIDRSIMALIPYCTVRLTDYK